MVQKKRKELVEKQAASASPSKTNNRRLKSDNMLGFGLDLGALSKRKLPQ